MINFELTQTQYDSVSSVSQWQEKKSKYHHSHYHLKKQTRFCDLK